MLFPFCHPEEENLGVMYLASRLRAGGHRPQVVEATEGAITRRLADGEPSVLAFSTLAFYARNFLALNRRVRSSFEVFSLFGGHHPTGCPELVDEPGVDAVCLGEGDLALAELCDRLEAGEGVDDVENLWVKAPDGSIVRNPPRPLIQDLDSVPFPDRSLFPVRAPFFQERIGVITSRGCHHSCPYCYNSTIQSLYQGLGPTYRRRSCDSVIEEICRARADLPVRFVLFHDDIFARDPLWLEEFARRYRREVGIPFNCNVRIDQVTPELVDCLVGAGCHSVSFGLESGDRSTRTDVLDRPMENQQIVESARMLRARGIRLRTTNIVAARPGSLAADLTSIRLNIRCGVDFAKVGALARYPRTGMDPGDDAGGQRWGELEEVSPPLAVRILGALSRNQLGRYQRKENMFFLRRGHAGDVAEAAALDNLQKLFPLVVAAPPLLRVLRPLLRLPLGRPLVLANFIWDNYCSYFRIYDAGPLSLLRGLIAYHRARRRAA